MHTIPSVLDRARTLFHNSTVSDGASETTYEQAYENAQRLAGGLADRGVDAGTVVAVADWNTPKFFELLYAITGMEAIIYPVNLNLPPEQIGYTLEKSDSTHLIYSDDFEALAQQFPGETLHTDDLEESDPVTLDVEEDTPAVMLFTSGTTGKPKPVRYTHEQFIHGGVSIAHQLTEYDTPASLSGEDTLLPSIPMFHLLAWGSPVIAPYLGADLLMTGQYDPETVGSLVEDGEATWTNMVPTMARQLLETDHSLDGLKVLTGGSTIQRDLVSRFREHDIEFSTIYGGTDMLAASISIWSDEARNKGGYEYLRRGTHPGPFGKFQLVHREGMEDDMGEIQFRAPWLPDGYYKLPEKTADAFVDGWFNTGDIGRRMPDGGIRILDRVDDTIKSGGEWIPSSILESIIVDTTTVANAAVLGKPDDEWGERPVAAVTPVDDTFEKESVYDQLAEAVEKGQINDWWIPDEIFTLDELPLTSTGKIQKETLRERLDLKHS